MTCARSPRYVAALRHGVERIRSGQLPLSLRLIRDLYRYSWKAVRAPVPRRQESSAGLVFEHAYERFPSIA